MTASDFVLAVIDEAISHVRLVIIGAVLVVFGAGVLLGLAI